MKSFYYKLAKNIANKDIRLSRQNRVAGRNEKLIEYDNLNLKDIVALVWFGGLE